MTPHRRTSLVPVLLVALGLFGCGGTLRALPPASELEGHAAEDLANYQIGATDVLRISVWRQSELTVDPAVVRLDGKISVPLLDDVQAAGLTPLELKKVLTERYGEYITSPTVTVIVSQINSKLVYVIGEVPRPGPLAIRGDFRVVDALASAGGFSPFAGKSSVKIIRNANGSGPVEFRFDYDEFVSGENVEQNILLLPGDKIVVPEEAPFWK